MAWSRSLGVAARARGVAWTSGLRPNVGAGRRPPVPCPRGDAARALPPRVRYTVVAVSYAALWRPTRLLDWSLSPLVALFFATETDDSVNGTLWGLSPGGLNKAQVGDMGLFVPHTKKLQPFFNAAFGDAPGPSPEKIIAIAPHETDVRMLVQQSVFTIHGTSRDLATLEEASTFLWRCDVDASAKDLIRRELDLLGIDRFRLFPDLSTLGREVGRIHAENRPDPPQAKK